MGMKSEGNTITCDCGFSFQRGQSGKHECADGLRAKLAAAVRREDGMKAIVDVMGLRITDLEQRLQQPASTVSFYRDGIMAAAKWVDQQRETYDNEHGRHDPDTGSFEFGNSAQEEHSSTLQDIADGIRSLHPYAKNTAPAVIDERLEFETLIEKEFGNLIDRSHVKNGGGGYFAWDMQVAWRVWQGRAALQAGNSPVIPDGWMLVPNEPTAKQWAAGYKAMEGGIDKVTLAYRAMIAEAPTPEE
ncbi:hypothetical protein [Serratia fonticola]